MMTVGITGFTGFLGSSLERLFINQGYFVFRLDIRLYDTNLNFIKELENVSAKLDLIIHAAGNANVPKSFVDTREDFCSNVETTFVLLDSIKSSKHKNAKFILLSSAAVYGQPIELPVRVDHIVRPISPYGFHKLMGESLAQSYSKCFGLRTAIVRIFSAYGENNRKQVLWELCRKANQSSKALEVVGTGEETRDFIHVEDLFSQLLLIIKFGSFESEIYNVANGQEIPVSRVALEVARNMGINQVTYSNLNLLGYPSKWVADISFMIGHGYSPAVSIEKGIEQYCNWFKEHYC